ncbi:hypothetical protein ASPBRDRAFT_47748 [Aspergillus brasiliensis CBS 101740]|uniref:Uncharacterized protein n=1 Tax=Aspergillus brasiliensis (strain CBS 101740 / IMI 381727 / IBT 21946) TaxID=767769 RepID=A0A1L9U801_ASPBC|nr:hypothetical protein ASPBRDRAFT_47748 [Aspergillus brasiliensis CBS 101740]
MYFSLTSKNIWIYTNPSTRYTYLSASCQDMEGLWNNNTIVLDNNFTYSEAKGRLVLLPRFPINSVEKLCDQLKPESLSLKGKPLLVGTAINHLGGSSQLSVLISFSTTATDSWYWTSHRLLSGSNVRKKNG